MRKPLLVLGCCLSIILPLKAQLIFSSSQKLNGYVILLTGDTLRGTIKQPENGALRQNQVQLYDASKNKVVYKPKELKGYVIEAGGKAFPYEAKSIDGHRYLLSKLNDGPMKLYQFYQGAGMVNSAGNLEVYFIEKPGQNQYRFSLYEDAVGEISFRKRALPFFGDCPSLSEQIQGKEVKFKDMEQIVKTYNQWWLARPSH